jgi:hypothetical protein
MAKELLSLIVALATVAAAERARAQEVDVPPDPTMVEQQGFPYNPPPVPPNVEESPVSGPGGSFCYNGPHPVDTRAAAGPAWDDASGSHSHFYPPIDLRLFSFHDGCYTFVGDPVDFGYQGQVYSYYGAHPLMDAYGGGWCFMVGAHAHAYRPWSPSFVVVGPWYYWNGAYDATFWSYWPYYSYYYRSYYPNYYGGGRFFRNRGGRVAPPIRRIPTPYGYPGSVTGRAGRGAGPQSWRGTPPASGTFAPGNTWRAPATGSGVAAPGTWRTTSPAPPPPPPAHVRVPPAGVWTSPPGGGLRVPPATPPPATRPTGATFGGHPQSKNGVRR